MNIFFLSRNPREAARLHCDKHVVKMILETAQLLYSAHWVLNPEGLRADAYKLAHRNHPCAIWVRTSLTNYMWLVSLGWWLCKEYQYRYGDHKVHKTEAHIVWLMSNPPKSIPFINFTRPCLAMPDQYKQEDPIESYMLYYIESKFKERNIVNYTKREWPYFLRMYIAELASPECHTHQTSPSTHSEKEL
jgi:hypothetical protein